MITDRSLQTDRIQSTLEKIHLLALRLVKFSLLMRILARLLKSCIRSIAVRARILIASLVLMLTLVFCIILGGLIMKAFVSTKSMFEQRTLVRRS